MADSKDVRDVLASLEPVASQSGAFAPSPADSLRETLDDEDIQDGMSMAQLKAQLERERAAAAKGEGGLPGFEARRMARSSDRDDELLADPPRGDHHLGRLGGWRAGSKLRWIVGGTLGIVVLVGIVIVVQYQRELGEQRRHPLPEVEATISPGTPREMNIADGEFRLGLGREAPAVNVIHLPDRDITLAGGAEKAQFKVEVRDGKTLRLEVLTGEIQEQLTAPGAQPLL